MRILVTGANGFVGSHLACKLANTHTVYAMARRAPITRGLGGLEWIECDLTEPLDTSRLPRELDAIIHLAQSRHYRQFPEYSSDIFDVNVNSTLRLLEYGRQVDIRQFIFASSGGIYGFREEEFVETDPVNPLHFYLTSKYCAELLIANYHQLFSTVVLRLFFVYGERQSQTMLIPRLVRSVLNGRAISLQGSDGLRSNPIYVGDAVFAFEEALSLEGNHLINVAGPEILSLREMGRAIGAALNCEPVFKVYSDHEPTHLIGDLHKMKMLLGEPTVKFANAVTGVCREAVEEAAAQATAT